MNKLKIVSNKRSRPLLGTFFNITIFSNESDVALVSNIFNSAFERAAQLESIFSKFQKLSVVNKLNDAETNEMLEVPGEFYEILKLTTELWKESSGAFNPFFPGAVDLDTNPFITNKVNDKFNVGKTGSEKIDLNGIAKGFIVDQVVSSIIADDTELSGIVNAGGDLKFFNTQERSVRLKLGNPLEPIVRTIKAPADCLATSSLSNSIFNENSSSRYSPKLRAGLNEFYVASVAADRCWIADGLTKVALYAEPATLDHCAKYFNSKIFLFDEAGTLTEAYGEL